MYWCDFLSVVEAEVKMSAPTVCREVLLFWGALLIDKTWYSALQGALISIGQNVVKCTVTFCTLVPHRKQ